MSGVAALLTHAILLGDSAKPPPDSNALVILAVFLVIAAVVAGMAVLLSRIGRR